MNGRSLTVLVLAVFLGLGAMLATRHLMSKPAAVEEESQEILVAARDFKEEEILKPDMIKTARTSKSAVPVGAFSSFKDVEERWVKTTMLEGDPIVDKKLGPKGSPPGLVANIPKGMRAYTVDVTEQSGVSGFILPNHRVDVVRYEANEKSQLQRSETILQDILVLAAGQVFTRQEEKSLQNRTVTLAVFPEQVHILVAARAKGPLSLSLRGVNDHDIVDRPTPKPEESEEQKARRTKMEKELEELKLALAKKMAEPPPPPPAPKPPEPRPPQKRKVYIYRPLQDKEAQVVVLDEAPRKIAQKKLNSDDDEPSSFGFGTTTVTKVDADGKSTIDKDH
ncbi:MAG: Flp pilus assembly protein CpaB [Planctomycetaceae bacterium]|nr:Flp pilus assembly protein CpaB [Planctomycetaceae bacterium]MBV8312549.1 Flp pilus assembly protein CpaB [Planctomycetaceae bacterium]